MIHRYLQSLGLEEREAMQAILGTDELPEKYAIPTWDECYYEIWRTCRKVAEAAE